MKTPSAGLVRLLVTALLMAGCAPVPSAGPAAAPETAAAPDRRAILVSFDALSERRVLETLPADAVPAFRSLFAGARCAEYALPAWPSKTSASHAAIWTGAFGDVSGIAANWQPPLPRDRHRITELVSGFSAEGLRAEPIWIAAALAGRRVVGHHITQGPGAPGYPPVTGERDAERIVARAAARSALADPGVTILNGYAGAHAPDLMLTAETAPPREPAAWTNLDRLGETLPPREIAWQVGGDSIFALFYGRDRYTGVLVAPARDAALGVSAAAAPVERAPVRGRELARHFSAALPLATPQGRMYLRGRLFERAPDASSYLLFQPALPIVAGSRSEDAAAYLAAIGGWAGNGGRTALSGRFGRPLEAGGDGTAEFRYLETLEYVTRQFMRGSERAWARGPHLLLDYFPGADEADHFWYGYVVPGRPDHDPALAAAVQEVRARAWALVDLRLEGLQRLVAGDSSAALFVTGDHGMRDSWRIFRPNVALAAAGLLVVNDSGRVDAARTRALAPDGLYVMANTTDWLDGTVPPDSAAAVLRAADSVLRAVRGPDGRPVVTQTWIVLEPDSLGRGGPTGGGLYYETAPGYDWDAGTTGAVAEAHRVAGNHGYPSVSPDMYTVLCASGPAFTPGRVAPARITDAAPSVAAWLGIPPPRFATGRAALTPR